MKKEDIYNAVSEIRPEYLDEADDYKPIKNVKESVSAEKYYDINTVTEIQRTHVMKKKFSWSRIVSAAACIAAVAAVPVIVSRINTAHINSEDETTSASDVPEITEPALVTEIKEDSEKTEELSYDRFPEPLYKFYYLTAKSITDYDTRYYYDRDEGKFEIRFLKDKEFENQINSEIAELIASMPSDFEFPETAPSAFYSSKLESEDFDSKEGETRELFIIPNVTNGYFSFMLAVRITDNQTGFERYEYARSFVYDLIEKKKINTLNEFFGGDDSEALIQKYCEENEMPGEITGFANFNIICSNGEESEFIPFDWTFAVENNIPFAETRNFSEILADGFTTESEEKSCIKWGGEEISYNGKGCSYDILRSSPLYPDFWVEKHNSIKKVIMEDMLRDFVENGYDMNYISTNQKIISDEILELQLPDSNPDYMKNCYSYNSPHKVIYDAETLEKINITDIFTEEGLDYIYQNAEDMDFDSKEEFIEMLNEGKITCSVDVMNEANMVTVWIGYNDNINLPADMMNSKYFDYDNYCEYSGD